MSFGSGGGFLLVISHQYLSDLRPGKLQWQRLTCCEQVPHARSRQHDKILWSVVRHIAHHDYTMEFSGVCSVVGIEDFNFKGSFGYLARKYFLSIKGSIKVSYAGVIATYNKMRTARVLAENSM